MKRVNVNWYCCICCSNSYWSGVAITAAWVGVAALMSAAKSLNVKSVSWPTADIIGVLQLYIARTTASSLKFHKSSMDPPPRPTIMVSTPKLSAYSIFSIMSSFAFSPWTKVLICICSANGKRLFIVEWISRIAAPVLAVKTAIFFGNLGIDFLFALSKQPSSVNFFFNASNFWYKFPIPSNCILFT